MQNNDILGNNLKAAMNIRNAYNEWSGVYDSNENLTRDLDQKVTRDMFAERHFASILELGCGTGKNTAFLVQIGRNVHALDFSEGMIEKAKEKVTAENIRFSMVDLTKRWTCEDAAYDLIVCNLVLEHIEDLKHIFFQAARTLMPGGSFFINELHPFKQYKGTKARFERGEEIIEVDVFIHHVSDFTNAAESSGLKLVKLNEYWHEKDENKPPRLISFLFEKA
jgi:ubiquinone/menaquinone biosynthesis C-methylase UbiE